MPNRTEGTWRKPSHIPTGRLPSLRLFSTLLAIAQVDQWSMSEIALRLLRRFLLDGMPEQDHHRQRPRRIASVLASQPLLNRQVRARLAYPPGRSIR